MHCLLISFCPSLTAGVTRLISKDCAHSQKGERMLEPYLDGKIDWPLAGVLSN